MVVKAVHSAQEKAQESRAADLFKTFVAEKKAQAIAAATAEGRQFAPEYDAFFAAAEKGNLPVMQRTLEGLEEHPPPSGTSLEAWMVATSLALFMCFPCGTRSMRWLTLMALSHPFRREAFILPACPWEHI